MTIEVIMVVKLSDPIDVNVDVELLKEDPPLPDGAFLFFKKKISHFVNSVFKKHIQFNCNDKL